ncbi:MAG TPA: hypothetical protein VF801_01800, partial [Rhodocyclaceae bacterium]
FFRRIEVAFPVLEKKLKQRVIKEGLRPYLADNAQAWEMASDGQYHARRAKRNAYSAQEALLAEMALATL